MPKITESPELVPGSFRHVLGIKEMYAKSGAFTLRTIQIERGAKEELGFTVREGDGWGRTDGIFISRILLGSVYDVCSHLSVGDEIVKIDDNDVKTMNIGQAIRSIYDRSKLSITLKIKTPFAKKRIGKRWRKINEPPVHQQEDYKILNMKINVPKKERHVYVPNEEPEGREPTEEGEEAVNEE